MKQQKSIKGAQDVKRTDKDGIGWELPIPANDNLLAIDLDGDTLLAENDNEADFDLSETGLVFSQELISDESQNFADPFYSGDMPKELDFADGFNRRGFLSE